ncbi:hypothetical protein [Hymenobacter sp. B81]|uniref:hypothetical protein n=1 Tax=Hymenobacter sp. B81 TaxID=3344878 RepID=UPI0037DC9E0A
MRKYLLLLLCALLLMDPSAVLAEPLAAEAATEAMEAVAAVAAPPRVPRPSYKKYKGNSRRKYRRNVFRRLSAKKKAKKKAQAAPRRRGIITVEPPVRNQ